ncbi:hypothetical protein AGMMS50267_10670 [Spirochaetia bacterium]|nr:hypothetical protein AGMMS50267_10670 [Spirochaetia bacterium]
MVEIPANHRLTLEIPLEIPAGRGILTFTPAPDNDPFADLGVYLKASPPATIEEAKKEAAAKLADPNRKPFSRHFGAIEEIWTWNHTHGEELRAKLQKLRGSLSAGAFGGLDGVTYQRKVRDEWDAD